jgi:hypothetical protein
VAPAEAEHMVRTADLLLVPAQGWHLQIPNKLFDYLGSRVPILALAEPGSETMALLQAAGGHHVVPVGGETALPHAAHEALLAAARRMPASDPTVLQPLTVSNQMTRLINYVEGLKKLPHFEEGR